MRTLPVLAAFLAALLIPIAQPAAALDAPACPAEPLALLDGGSTEGGSCGGCGGGWIEVRIGGRTFCIVCPERALGPLLP